MLAAFGLPDINRSVPSFKGRILHVVPLSLDNPFNGFFHCKNSILRVLCPGNACTPVTSEVIIHFANGRPIRLDHVRKRSTSNLSEQRAAAWEREDRALDKFFSFALGLYIVCEAKRALYERACAASEY